MCKASIAAQLVKLKSYLPKFRNERASEWAQTSFAFNFISFLFVFLFFLCFVHYSIFKIIFSFFLFAQHVRVCMSRFSSIFDMRLRCAGKTFIALNLSKYT